jgi:hypothetical protein
MERQDLYPDHEERVGGPANPTEFPVQINRTELTYEANETPDYADLLVQHARELRDDDEQRKTDRYAVYIPFTRRRIEWMTRVNSWMEEAGRRQINIGSNGEIDYQYEKAGRLRKYLKPVVKVATGLGAAGAMVIGGVPFVAPTVFMSGLKQAYDGAIEAIQKAGWGEKWQTQEQATQETLSERFREAAAEIQGGTMTPERFNALLVGIKAAEQEVIKRQSLNTKSETNQRRFRAVTSGVLAGATGLWSGIPTGIMDVDNGATSVPFKGEMVEVLKDHSHRTMVYLSEHGLNFDFMYNRGKEALDAAKFATEHGMKLTQYEHVNSILKSLYGQFHTMGGSLTANAWEGLATAAGTMTATILEQWRNRKMNPKNKELEISQKEQSADYGYGGQPKGHYSDISEDFVHPLDRAREILGFDKAGRKRFEKVTTTRQIFSEADYRDDYIEPQHLTETQRKELFAAQGLSDLSPELAQKVNLAHEKFHKRFEQDIPDNQWMSTEKFFALYLKQEALAILSSKLDAMQVGEKLYDPEVTQELPLRKGLDSAEQIAIVFDDPIGDSIIAGMPIVDAIDKYLVQTNQTKPLVIMTAHPDLYKDIANTYGSRVKVIGYTEADAYFKPTREAGGKIFVVNAKKSFGIKSSDYKVFGLSEGDELDPEKVMSVDYRNWYEKHLANTGENEGAATKYDRMGARILRSLELCLGEKLYQDINAIDHILEKPANFEGLATALRERLGIQANERVITISAGAGTKSRELMAHQWFAIVTKIYQQYPDAHIVFLQDHSPERFESYTKLVTDLKRNFGERFSSEKLGLGDVVTLIGLSEMTITPDTGIAHVAGAYGVDNITVHLGNSVSWSQKNSYRINTPAAKETYRKGGSTYRPAWYEENKQEYHARNDQGEWVGASDVNIQEILIGVETIRAKHDHRPVDKSLFGLETVRQSLEDIPAAVKEAEATEDAVADNTPPSETTSDSQRVNLIEMKPGDEIFPDETNSRVMLKLNNGSWIEVGSVSKEKDGRFFVLGLDGNSVKNENGDPILEAVSIDRLRVVPRNRREANPTAAAVSETEGNSAEEAGETFSDEDRRNLETIRNNAQTYLNRVGNERLAELVSGAITTELETKAGWNPTQRAANQDAVNRALRLYLQERGQ